MKVFAKFDDFWKLHKKSHKLKKENSDLEKENKSLIKQLEEERAGRISETLQLKKTKEEFDIKLLDQVCLISAGVSSKYQVLSFCSIFCHFISSKKWCSSRCDNQTSSGCSQ